MSRCRRGRCDANNGHDLYARHRDMKNLVPVGITHPTISEITNKVVCRLEVVDDAYSSLLLRRQDAGVISSGRIERHHVDVLPSIVLHNVFQRLAVGGPPVIHIKSFRQILPGPHERIEEDVLVGMVCPQGMANLKDPQSEAHKNRYPEPLPDGGIDMGTDEIKSKEHEQEGKDSRTRRDNGNDSEKEKL